MSLLEHPLAQALLADAEVSAADVRGCHQRLQRYLPRFYRQEQREWAEVVLQGKLCKLERKTSEPIAYLADRERKPVQHFVGAGTGDDEAVMAELRRHVAETLGHADAVLDLDPSGFPKKGTASFGVAGNPVGGRGGCPWSATRRRRAVAGGQRRGRPGSP
jgi:SRSO17 transposase